MAPSITRLFLACLLLSPGLAAQSPWPRAGVVCGPAPFEAIRADGVTRPLFASSLQNLRALRPIAVRLGAPPAPATASAVTWNGLRSFAYKIIDENRNGVLDEAETPRQVFGPQDQEFIWHDSGQEAAALRGSLFGPSELIRLRDLDGNGRFREPGEERLVLSLQNLASTATVRGLVPGTRFSLSASSGFSFDRSSSITSTASGMLVAGSAPGPGPRGCIFRFRDVGNPVVWFHTGGLPFSDPNVHFGSTPHPVDAPLQFARDDASLRMRTAVIISAGFQPATFSVDREIFDVIDLNGDGDGNDAGETRSFFTIDFATVPGRWDVDSIDVHAGVVLVQMRRSLGGPVPERFLLVLEDRNGDGDARDPGESDLVAIGGEFTGSRGRAEEAFIDDSFVFASMDTCTRFRTVAQVSGGASSGGALTIGIEELPADLQTAGGLGVGLVSARPWPGLTWATPRGSCQVGIAFDALTEALLDLPMSPLVNASVTSSTATIGSLPFGPGIPPGTELRVASLLITTRITCGTAVKVSIN